MRQSLPIPSTSFVGRDLEVAAAATSIRREDVRLLTLTGPPGIGKTRLALAAAAVLHREFEDGVYFVNLAPVSDADLVLPTITHTHIETIRPRYSWAAGRWQLHAFMAIRRSSPGRCMVWAPLSPRQLMSRNGSLAEAEALFRELEDKPGLAHVLNSIGEFARVRGEDERAKCAYAASLDIFAQLGDRRAEYTLLYNLGFIAQHEGDHREAMRLLRCSLELCRELGVPAEVARELLALAGSLGVMGDPAGAARLFGAADAFLQQSGALLDPDDLPEHERNLGLVRAALGDEQFDVTWAEGEAMALEEAAEYACVQLVSRRRAQGAPLLDRAGLSLQPHPHSRYRGSASAALAQGD